MAKTSRETWLDDGLKVLRQDGIEHVRIDTLCKRLGMTKGSFYHHFKNHQSYLEDLLAYWEEKYTSQFIDYAEKGTTPLEKIKRLNDVALSAYDDPEIHIRAWALTDDVARETVARVDQRRIDYLVKLYTELGMSDEQALVVSRTIYATLIGTSYLLPHLNQQDVLEMFNYIAGLNTQNKGDTS